MSAPNNLEKTGNISRHPVAELLVEIADLKFNGSLRISKDGQKFIIYFEAGRVVFAVSNSRKDRLFEILLDQKQITKEELSKIENFTNDMYLAQHLVTEGRFRKQAIDRFFVYQIKLIIQNAVGLSEGVWTFSSLARIKEGIGFEFDFYPILYGFSNNLDDRKIVSRFNSFDEEFSKNHDKELDSTNFSPPEAYVLSRMDEVGLSVENLRSMSGLPNEDVLRILYKLWMGGFVVRRKWNSVFSKSDVSEINSTNFTLKTSALSVEGKQQKIIVEKLREETQKLAEESEIKAAEAMKKTKEAKVVEISLEEYLQQIKDAVTHYEIFGLQSGAETAEIKKAYFSLAKKFHPDLFHKQVEAELHDKIQNAFTEIAHAYEILKNEESREVYDFKLRKVIEQINANNENGENSAPQILNITKEDIESRNDLTMAAESFDKGYDLLMNENYYEAQPHLGRAVHLDNNNPRYHAFYGKALSYDKNQSHKAEAELQTAIRLDAKNAIYRIMLAELFIEIGLFARAKGELKRLLQIAPDNREAQSLLDTLS